MPPARLSEVLCLELLILHHDPGAGSLRIPPGRGKEVDGSLKYLVQGNVGRLDEFGDAVEAIQFLNPLIEFKGLLSQRRLHLPSLGEMIHPVAQHRCRGVTLQLLVRRDVVEVLVDLCADHGERVGGQHVQQHRRVKAPLVILTHGQALAAREELIQLVLVLHQPLGAGESPQGPGHLAGHAEGRVALSQSLLRLGVQEGNHPVRVEHAFPRIGVVAREDLELPAGQVRFHIQPVVPQIAQDGHCGAGIDDVEHLLAPLQPIAQEGRQHGPVFLFRVVEAAEVVPRLQVRYRARDGNPGHGASSTCGDLLPNAMVTGATNNSSGGVVNVKRSDTSASRASGARTGTMPSCAPCYE